MDAESYVNVFWVSCFFITVAVIISLPSVLITGLLRRKAEVIKRERAGTVIALYEAPLGLKPAEIGFLYDMKCDQKEVQATLFDLERRKIIDLNAPRAGIIQSQSLYDTLEPFEKVAVNMLRSDNSITKEAGSFAINIQTETGIRSINIPLLPPSSLRAFTAAVRRSLAQKGHRTNGYLMGMLLRAALVGFILSLWPFSLAAIPGVSNEVPYEAWSPQAYSTGFFVSILLSFFLLPAYYIAGLIIVFIWVKIAGRVWLNTHHVRMLWPQLEGYRLYLKQVELDRVAYESLDPYDDPVTVALPYAMVYNLETKWQERFNQQQTGTRTQEDV